MTRRVTRAAAGAVLLAAAAGCGAGAAEVRGKVTFGGTPLTSGTVVFTAPGGALIYAEIGADGTYTAAGLTAGETRVGVSCPNPDQVAAAKAASRDPAGRPRAGRPADPPGWKPLPPRLADPDNSGLKTTLKAGPNVYDIDL